MRVAECGLESTGLESAIHNPQLIMRYGLIAGNGRFPFLVLDGARRAGVRLSVAAIREETDPEIKRAAAEASGSVIWVGIGQLGRMIRSASERAWNARGLGSVKQ